MDNPDAIRIVMEPPNCKKSKQQFFSESNGHDEKHMNSCKIGSDFCNERKVPVVVLTRLPEYKVSALRPPTPQQFYSEDESQSSSDSDTQWEPEGDSSDSDFTPAEKKQKDPKPPKTETNRPATPPSTSNNNAAPESSPIIISSVFAHCSQETTTVRPEMPETEITVDMVVLARKRPMKWYQGKILEIVEKEDGRLKYKVGFEETGKSLVSGHHLAFPTSPKLEELYVGARVVIQSKENKYRYQPGILCELPSRKNRLRFLVFLDDHTPIYVGLPLLRLICKPLENPLDDILDEPHRGFMKQYLRNWPYPHLTQYKPGQSIKAIEKEEMRMCDILMVDSSLIQVVFQGSHQREWIHRGSMRLEHMAKFLEMREKIENETDAEQ